jgi:hypothetical protein
MENLIATDKHFERSTLIDALLFSRCCNERKEFKEPKSGKLLSYSGGLYGSMILTKTVIIAVGDCMEA